LKKLANNIR